MRSPSNSERNIIMDSGTLDDRASVASDRNYMNAHRYLGTLQMRIRELTENETRDSEQLERLQQKALDIKEVFALIERELEGVEDKDWHPRLKLPPQLIEPEAPPRTASAPPEDVRPREALRPSGHDDPRASISNISSRYRPSEDYRPSPPPESIQHSRSPQPSPVPRAPSPPPAVSFAAVSDPRSGMRPAGGAQSPMPPRSGRDSRGPAPALAPQQLPPLPSNITFDHGPLFTDCIASLKLSDYVYDLADAKEDLKDDREKLRKAEEADDDVKVQKYRKRITQDETDIRELEQDHWKKEVNPLRQAYSVEILRCLQTLDVAIKYTEELTDQGKLEADAISDMRQLKDWLNKCLNQPKTWRKDDKLLVGLTEGYPRKLREASYVKDLLEEAAPSLKKKEEPRKDETKDKSNSQRSNSASSSATKPIAINGDLLEGLLNGAVPKEVAANITQCPECSGTGGDLEHAKICSECDGKGSHPDSHDAIELCPKCNGRGFALSKKYRCPVCDAYKIVMNVPVDTPDPRQAKDRDQPPPPRDADPGLQRSDSKRRKASFAEPEPAEAPPPRRSGSKKGRDRDRDRDRERDYSPDARQSDPEDDLSSRRKSKSGPSSSSSSSRRQRDRDRDYDGSSRSPSPVERSSRNRRLSQSQSSRGKDDQQPDANAGLTGLIGAIAGAAQEPGSWTGKKGKKILEAALAAGAGGFAGGAGGGGGGGSDDGRSESEGDDRRKNRKRRGSRY